MNMPPNGYLNRKINELNENKYLQITDHCMSYNALSGGTATEKDVTYRTKYVARVATNDLKLVYGNYYVPVSGIDTKPDDTITVKASIEIGSAIIPCTFNGASSIAIAPGGVIETDPVGVELLIGQTFWIRTFVSVDTEGKKYPTGLGTYSYVGEGITQGDITVTGAPTTATGLAYSPLAILGKGTNDGAVLLCGDSILTNSSTTTSKVSVNGGYAGWKLNEALIPYYGISRSGDLATLFNVPVNRQCRTKLIKNATHVICDYGINDISGSKTLLEIQNTLTEIWTMYVARGMKVFQTTITPYTTSTDSWATTANQTKYFTGATAGKETIRLALNAWIRTTPAPLSGYFDAADIAESSRDSGIWNAGYTSDGLHPNDTGTIAIAECINLSMLGITLNPNRYIYDNYASSNKALYSVARKLTSTATYAFRIRESGGNTERDIGFVGEYTDVATLSSFVGANSGYVVKVYDQSGNGNHAIQTADATKQPRIVNAGTIDKSANGLPTMVFDGSNDELVCSTLSSITDNLCSVFSVFKQLGSANALNRIMKMTGNSASIELAHNGSTTLAAYGASNPTDARVTVNTVATSITALSFMRSAINSVFAYRNSVQVGTNTTSSATALPTSIAIGSASGANYSNIELSEIAICSALTNVQRKQLEENQISFYSIT